jgi:hypothetical protein
VTEGAAWTDQARARLLEVKQGWDLDNIAVRLPWPRCARLSIL